MVIIGRVAAALGATTSTKQSLQRIRELLCGETSRKGFRGRRRTRQWCCRVNAFAHYLAEDGLVVVPRRFAEASGIDAGSLACLAITTEIAWWQLLDERLAPLGAVARFRHFVARIAPRLGAIFAVCGRLPAFICDPSWVRQEVRGAWLRDRLRERGLTSKQFATDIGVDQDTVTRWLRGGNPKPVYAVWIASALAKHAERALDHVVRDVRWHFALARLADDLAKEIGRDAVNEAVAVLGAVCSCAYERVRETAASSSIQPDVLFVVSAVGTTLLRCDGLEMRDHLVRHGASAEFIADVARVEEVWTRLLGDDSLPRDMDLRVIAHQTPRLRQGEVHFGRKQTVNGGRRVEKNG